MRTEPKTIETTNVIATLYSKARATTVTGYKFTAIFSEKKVHCSQVSNGNKNRLDHESFYQSNIERLLHLNPDNCKNELLRLNITRNKNTDRKLVNFQVFANSVQQAELERYQGHIKLDEKYPYNGAHGRLIFDIQDKHWIPHIGLNNPSNYKADSKNKSYQEIMFFDWKIQLEKIQLTRDLNPQTSTRISFQDNPYTFEERQVRLSEPLEPVQRQASLKEPTYNLYPTLPQDLNRERHINQNQNTVEKNRQIIHARRKRNFQIPRVYFDIPQSPTPTTSEISRCTLPETPTLLSQQSTSNIPSDYLCSTPTSEQIRENPFNPPPPNPTARLPYWTTHSYT